MSDRAEQPVLDAIDKLVEWQMTESRGRGDGPEEQPDFELPDYKRQHIVELLREWESIARRLEFVTPTG